MTNSFEDSLLSDDALTEFDDELFGRSHLVERVIEVLGRVKAQSTSSTIGLVGAWGSGKSSVLANVAGKIRLPDRETNAALKEEWLVAEFNPWLFSDSRSLHAGFFTLLRDAFPKGKQWDNARGKLIDLGRYIAPAAGFVAAFLGGDAETPGTKLLDQFEQSAAEQHKLVAAELRKHKQPILVIVDDLDRLTASELLEVFKLVRLVGRLPYVYYLLSYDEHTLIDLLAKTDLVSAEDDRRALEYLEKIVQIRLDMPLLRPFEIDRVVDRVLTALVQKHRVGFDEETKQTLTVRFDDVMSKRLRTPRSLKRLFGQIDAFLPSIGDEVHFGDYVVVTWLRTMEPGVYDLIQRRRSELLGIDTDPFRSLQAGESKPSQKKAEWEKLLEVAHVAGNDRDDVLWLLSTVFPVVAAWYLAGSQPSAGTRSAPDPGRISNPDYFDRFFAFGVPADDIADAMAHAGLRQIVAGDAESGEAAKKLLTAFSKDARLALRKITQAYHSERSSSPSLVRWAAERWRLATDDTQVQGRIETLSAEFMSDLDSAEVASVATSLMATDEGLLFISRICSVLGKASYGTHGDLTKLAAAHSALLAVLSGRWASRFAELAVEYPTPADLPEIATSIAMRWYAIDDAGMKAFLETVTPSSWAWIDVLMWLAPVITYDGGETYWIGPKSSSTIYYRLFDLDRVAAEISADIAMAPPLDALTETEATPAARRQYALAAVRDAADLSARAAADNASDTAAGH